MKMTAEAEAAAAATMRGKLTTGMSSNDSGNWSSSSSNGSRI